MVNISDLFKLGFYVLVILVIMVLLGKNMFHQRFPAITPYAAVYKSINAVPLLSPFRDVGLKSIKVFTAVSIRL
jgi:hypothetical protein